MKKPILILTIILIGASLHAGNRPDKKLFSKKYIRSVMETAACWQFDHPKHALYDWTNGAFYAGVFAAWETTGSKKMWNNMMAMGDSNQWKAGPRLEHADDHVIGQTYIDMYRVTGDGKMIAPFRARMDEFMASPYKTGEISPITWWWCDALFMAPPAMVKLGMTLGEDKYLRHSDRLFRETYDLLYDKEERLFARDIRYQTTWKEPIREANGEKIFWSRGNGWVLGGLVRVLEELPANDETRPFYEGLFREMAARVAGLQQEDGLWRASLLDPESYPGGEASGSGFFVYALAWGINNGLLDRGQYLPAVRKGWKGLTTLIQPDGHVGWCQPIGADPRKNFTPGSWEVYGTGAFLLAGSEVIKVKW
ncbi:MAG: glycoside hydrolase family 88 protein [Mangrovibacterium sp.]|nr:glycoside hydrolase family 88 protein [Mangrovibacterium sp.]